MSLYAIKNGRGEWYDWKDREFWTKDACAFVATGNHEEAERMATEKGGHVVKLVEKPTPVVVNQEEAKILEGAKKDKHPCMYIAWKVQVDDEDRLMRAYVNGWVVEKPKLWNVKVPHTEHVWYFKRPDNPGVLGVRQNEGLLNDHDARFTEAEVEHYGLQDCEKTDVPNED